VTSIDRRAISTGAAYRRLLRYLFAYWPALLFSLLGFVLYALGTVLIADLLQYLFDALSDVQRIDAGLVSGLTYRWVEVGEGSALETARFVVPLALVAVAFLRAIGLVMGQYSIYWVARTLVHRLRCELFEAMMALPAVVLDGESQGAWVGRLTYNVEQVAAAVTDALKTALRESLMLLGLLAYMAYLNWQLCLVFVAVTPVIVWVVARVTRRFKRYSLNMQDAMGEVTQRANEGVAGYSDIRLFNAQAERGARFADVSAFNRLQSVKMLRLETLSTAFLQVWVALAFAVLVWLALQPQWLAGLTPGVLVAFLTAASQLGKPVRQLSGVLGVLQRGVVAAQDVFAQIERPSEADEGTLCADAVRGELALRDVSFTYPEGAVPALQDVSFSVSPGEVVAIVGRSGSGKTTLLRLLTRFYAPGAGTITLDGSAVEQYRLSSYRQQIAWVSQRPAIFRDSVFNNVCLGLSGDAAIEQVKDVLEQVGAMAFVEQLPEGLDTMLGDAGAGLSGGQQQRLAIARAMLKDACVLLLDEPTSALDPKSSAAILASLRAHARKRACLIIAHRMSTVETADRIIVMDGGRIVAQGLHRELLAQRGLYAELCEQELNA